MFHCQRATRNLILHQCTCRRLVHLGSGDDQAALCLSPRLHRGVQCPVSWLRRGHHNDLTGRFQQKQPTIRQNTLINKFATQTDAIFWRQQFIANLKQNEFPDSITFFSFIFRSFPAEILDLLLMTPTQTVDLPMGKNTFNQFETILKLYWSSVKSWATHTPFRVQWAFFSHRVFLIIAKAKREKSPKWEEKNIEWTGFERDNSQINI